MKKLDIAVLAVLIVGGLNWGLVGIAKFDLVAAIAGASSSARPTGSRASSTASSASPPSSHSSGCPPSHAASSAAPPTPTDRKRRTDMFNRIALVVVVLTAALAGTATAAPTAAKPNVVQVATSAGQFKTLVALVKQAGLAGALSTKTVTVFAPTDAAFAKVPTATLAKLKKDRALLRRVLLYHVVAGRVPAAKAVTLTQAKTLEGSSLPIEVTGSTVTVGGAKVVKTDIAARNGIIHVIDRVLIPAA